MLNMGQQVLGKIQDLLVEIDKPKARKKKIKQRIQKSDHIGPRLYQHHKLIKQKFQQRQRDKICKQIQSLKPFKVTNKHSVFINNQNDKKPIYHRINQIIQEKERAILQRKMEKVRAQQLEQQKQYEQVLLYKDQRKFNKEQVDQLIQDLQKREKQRINKINLKKIQHMRIIANQHTLKPKLSKSSQKIWQKKQMQRSISTNVFQRFQQYDWERAKKQQQYVKERIKTQTPFQPKISQNSRLLADRSLRSPLTKDLERTTSCKCFQKHTTTHMKSISTNMHTSRYNISNQHTTSGNYRISNQKHRT